MFNFKPVAYTVSGFHDVNGQPVEDLDPVNMSDEGIKGYIRSELTRIGARGVRIDRPTHAIANSRFEYEFTIGGDRHLVVFDVVPYGGTYPVKLSA